MKFAIDFVTVPARLRPAGGLFLISARAAAVRETMDLITHARLRWHCDTTTAQSSPALEAPLNWPLKTAELKDQPFAGSGLNGGRWMEDRHRALGICGVNTKNRRLIGE